MRAFAPVADAYVSAAAPHANTARLKRLTIGAAPTRRAYMRFELRGLTSRPEKATLRVLALTTSRAGFTVRTVARPKIAARRLAYRSAPRVGARVADSGPIVRGRWVSIDVTRAVPANGTATFALTTSSRRAIALASTEAGPRLAPRLEVELTALPRPGGALPAAPSGPSSGDPPPSSPAGAEAPAEPSGPTSRPLAAPAGTAPKATAPPTISGAAQDKQMLRTSPGKWAGTSPIAVTFQWQRCDKAGAGCADVAGATDPAYPVGAVDVGSTLRVAVTAANGAGAVTEVSKPTAVVKPVPPALSGGVSIWRFDELSGTTAADASGHSNGKAKNIALGRPGLQNTAYLFNGKSSVVVVPSSSRLNPGSSPFTVTVHLNFTQNPSASVGDYDLIRKGRADTLGGEYKMEILQNGKSLCEFKGSAGAASVEGGPSINDGAWHTVQCVKRSGSVSLVVDGKSYTSSGDVGSISNDAPLAIGAKAEGGDWYAGLMDEVGYAIN